jgi:heterodisulfide reductase subunit A
MHFTDAQILAQIRALLAERPEEKIFAFRCQWCSYGGADLAGTSHFDYSANERGIRVMCSARMDSDFIYEAFRLGAGAVMYSGCHPQDCHYITGQRVGATRADRLMKTLTKLGMSDGRFRIEWISAAEGDKYSRVINEMQQTINDIGLQQILAENASMRPELEKRSRRMYEVPMVPEASTYSDKMAIAMSVTEVKDGK